MTFTRGASREPKRRVLNADFRAKGGGAGGLSEQLPWFRKSKCRGNVASVFQNRFGPFQGFRPEGACKGSRHHGGRVADRIGVSPAMLYRYIPAARAANAPDV